MAWLTQKLGWLLCLAGGLAMVAAVYALIGLLPLIEIGGEPARILTVVLWGGAGLGLAWFGTAMCRI
jgi:hypothetical protein